MSLLTEKLEHASETFEMLTEPPLTVFEIVETVEVIGEIVLEFEPAATEEEYEAPLREAWAWADGKYRIVAACDEALKFPIYLAPAELFDGPAIRFVAERLLIPQLAKKLADHIG